MPNRKPYPTDVSDEEWSFVAPYLALIREDAPPSARTICARSSTPCAGSCAQVRLGGCCPTTSHHGRRSTSRPRDGSPQAASRRWSTTYGRCFAWLRAAQQSRRAARSWTAARCARRPRVATAPATTAPSVRRARRCMRRSTLWGTCSPCASRRQPSRTGRRWRSSPERYRKPRPRAWSWPTWTGATRARNRPKRRRSEASGLRWSSTRAPRRASCSCHADGWWSAVRVGYALSQAGQRLRAAARHGGGAALRGLRVPLPSPSGHRARVKSITRSRKSRFALASGEVGLALLEEYRNALFVVLRIAAQRLIHSFPFEDGR